MTPIPTPIIHLPMSDRLHKSRRHLGSPSLIVATLALALLTSLAIPIITALRVDTGYWYGHHVGSDWDQTVTPRGWIDLYRGTWTSEAWFIPRTDAIESQLARAGMLDEADATLAEHIPPWAAMPQEAIGTAWSPTRHEQYGSRTTAFGFPFRCLLGSVSLDETHSNSYAPEYFRRYVVFELDGVPDPLRAALEAIADPGRPMNPVTRVKVGPPDDRWLPHGILPLGLIANTLCFSVVIHPIVIGAVTLTRRANAALRLRAGRCPRCRYSLEGITDETCPECGTHSRRRD